MNWLKLEDTRLAFVYTLEYTAEVKLEYEWDEQKDKSNFRKHGVWFEEARTIWADAQAVELFDGDHSGDDEDRFIRVGMSSNQKILLVVFCERNINVIRIVSARKATPLERKQYEEGI